MNPDSFTVKDRTCSIRRAAGQDIEGIKALILSSSIHASGQQKPAADGQTHRHGLRGFLRPLFRKILTSNINWRFFYVAALDDGTLIGCAQAKPHRPGILEITSFAIHREWRTGLVASKLSKYVIADSKLPLWGTCPDNIIPFHLRLGGRQVTDPGSMPGFLRRRMKIFNLIFRLLGSKRYLAVMALKTPET